MDSENQTNINPIEQAGESGIQSGESFTQTENMDGGINQELDTNSLISIQENNTGNRYELKPKKTKKWLYFLLGVLVGILLCLCYSLLLNNNGISNPISNTINSLSNRNGALSNTVNGAVADKSKLSGTYATDNSKYVIDFNENGTLRWTDKYMAQSTFEGTYEYQYEYNNKKVYELYVEGEGWGMLPGIGFMATFQPDGSLRIAGYGLFRKKS